MKKKLCKEELVIIIETPFPAFPQWGRS